MTSLIAVVDNNEAVRAMVAFIVQGEDWKVFGYSYETVRLSTIQQLRPDLIILDFIEHRLGEGWEFLQLLKMEESTAAIPIIISTTMEVLPPEVRAYLASRNISVVVKPFDNQDFISIARQVIAGQNAFLLSPTRRLPILLVDDNADLSSGFMEILHLEGYLATTVSNGQLALDALNDRRYCLIFLDMNMPVMTGPEFIAAYARQPGPHIPVIVFSSELDIDMALQPFFVIGRLAKPFNVRELLRFVSQYALPA